MYKEVSLWITSKNKYLDYKVKKLHQILLPIEEFFENLQAKCKMWQNGHLSLLMYSINQTSLSYEVIFGRWDIRLEQHQFELGHIRVHWSWVGSMSRVNFK